jgi:hypothetical protein
MASIVSPTISFRSHPVAPCGTLLVAHDTVREKWDNYGRIGFYLGPALTHNRSYHCFITDTNATRICDSVMFYPAPLVLPGASRFDQLLQLTERLVIVAESKDPEPDIGSRVAKYRCRVAKYRAFGVEWQNIGLGIFRL